MLADVVPGGPAEQAGLQVGDIILSLNGKPMENARQFHVNLYRQPLGSSVTLEVLRGGETRKISVPVILRLDAPERFAALADARQDLVRQLGVLAVPLDRRLLAWLPARPRRPGGVLVAKLIYGVATPLQPGDVIYSLNNRPLGSVEDLRAQLATRERGQTVILQVERDGKLRYMEVPIE
jgi:serine protease Do